MSNQDIKNSIKKLRLIIERKLFNNRQEADVLKDIETEIKQLEQQHDVVYETNI